MNNKSFTLIEILVVVLTISILSSVIYVVSSGARERADFAKVLMFSTKLNSSLAENIVGQWDFNEGTGSSVYDSSGNGNTGTITGSTWETNQSNCISSNCLVFDGTLGNYVQMSAISSLPAGKSFMISSWVYPEHTGTYRTIVGYNSTHRLLINSVGQMLSQQNGNFFSAGSGNVPNLKWTHVIYWYNIDEGTYGQERWYINGIQSGASNNLASQIAEWDAAFKVGQYDLANYPFKGKIDEIYFFDNYSSLSKINQIYITGLNNLFLKNQISQNEYLERIKIASNE